MTSPTPSPDSIDVSIVLPVFNEAGHVEAEVERIHRTMRASKYSYEIIAVDDGSSDGSGDVLEKLDDIRFIRLPQNRGSGFARKTGTRAARGEVVVWTDADMSYPNDTIPRLVDELGDYDQVVGARTSEEGTTKFLRVPAKWFIRKLASYLVRTKIPDLNSGFRAFRRSVALPYLRLLPHGFSCVTTITMSFLSNGHSVRYIDIEYAERAGKSKFHPLKDTGRYIIQVVRMVMTYNPLRFFLPVGGLMLAAALGKVVYDVVDKDFRITTNAIILTIVSFQVVAIGLLADLVARLAGPQD